MTDAPDPAGDHATSVPSRRRWLWVVGGIATLTVAVGMALAVSGLTAAPDAGPTSAPTAAATPAPVPTPTPTPSPTVAEFPANTVVYDSAELAQVDVFAVNAGLPVDDDPYAVPNEVIATPRAGGAPVFADPTAEPIGFLPATLPFDGTSVPVVERQEHWLKVLLVGRQALPSQGTAAQVAGWIRAADVDVVPSDAHVEVAIGARTIDIVRGGQRQTIATDFAWGTDATPTPLGRSYIMTTRVVPEFGYTRGHPIVYLSVQSPTLDGFGGADAAVTAFHYHDERSGAISNGCVRVDPAAIAALAELPEGTPVLINP
ncbi:L,D-transpeptidase [Microbacterium sp. NPDC077184]|uniref:L,D-transpeptidase n=1 Tax=Microbacterium sp. NPDC077184 TaxID=3154764 RepID=UPI003416EC5B